MSASSCRPSCGLRHPMAKLQNVCKLGTIPLFARTGSSAYGNRHGITISCTPPALAKAFCQSSWLDAGDPRGRALLQGSRLPLLATLGTGLSLLFKGPGSGPATSPEFSCSTSTLRILDCLSPICCPFSLNALHIPVPFYFSVGHPSLHLGFQCPWSTRGLRGSWSGVPGWDTPTTVW